MTDSAQPKGRDVQAIDATLQRFLARLCHYGPPDAEELTAISGVFTRPQSVSAGRQIVPQHAAPKESTLLLVGMAGRVVTLASGVQQITALQIPGDFVDLHAFLLPHIDHSVVAMSDCTVITAPHEGLKRVTDRFPRLARALWYLTLVDASIHRQWLTVLGRRESVARLAHLFCELYARFDDVGLVKDRSFVLPLTQAEVADVLGVSTVHVNRVAQELRARGLIVWEKRTVTITEWRGLAELAQFDPTYLQLDVQITD